VNDEFKLNDAALAVQRLVLCRGILHSNPEDFADDPSVRVIRTINDVDRFRDPDFPYSEIKESNWVDVMRVDDRLFYASPMSHVVALTETTNKFANEFDAVILSSCCEHLPEDECHYISTDLWWIMTFRAALGVVEESFVERRLSIYEKGGFPCGWCGIFPAGQLVVFIRTGDDSFTLPQRTRL
jgi:hypothetical protein